MFSTARRSSHSLPGRGQSISPQEFRVLADALRVRFGEAVAAILVYGSCFPNRYR